MKFIFTLPLLVLLAISSSAQTVPSAQSYGKVDQADLELKGCDFEKGANAEILFDVADVTTDGLGARTILVMERHVRSKIFNDFGKNAANIRIPYYSYMDDVVITDLKAQTINLVDGKIKITQLDKKQSYTEKVDKWHSALVFTFPDVKAGSIIEYKYRLASKGFPTWYFQNYIPTRYSELKISIPGTFDFKSIPHTKQPFVKSTGEGTDSYQLRAMANIHSMPNEPYMGSRDENLQRIEYIGINTNFSTWPKIAQLLTRANDFGYDMDRTLTGEDAIIQHAKGLNTDNERIAYIFDTVKNSMKWNKLSQCYTMDGTVKAWDTKTGNSAEINLIVYHLLKKAGIKAYPLLVCTKSNGKINPANATPYLFNNTVVYTQVDTTQSYVLDASDRYGLYNVIPGNILNSFGLSLDPHTNLSLTSREKDGQMVFIENELPSLQSVYVNAEIEADGKIKGDAEITSYAYNKEAALKRYNTDGEKIFIDSLRHNDNDLKIASFKIENLNVDSLPLIQKVAFNLNLSSSDQNYIYFVPTLFNSTGPNPFFKEERFSDIDFGYRSNFSTYGIYKMPAGFSANALPKSLTIELPDQSMIFKRTVAQEDGTIMVKYTLNHKKTIYFRESYQDIHDFYKKMYEMLNEQIVLKKG